MSAKNILAECYGDTLLVKQLKYSYLEYHSGVGQVANQMIRTFKGQKAIAIIDNDKQSLPSYFSRECELIKQKNGIFLLKHRTEDHYVIKISPAFEGFISNAANECKMEAFEKDKLKLKKITKDSKLHSNSRFVNYVNRVISQNPPSIKTLKAFIDEANATPTKLKKKK